MRRLTGVLCLSVVFLVLSFGMLYAYTQDMTVSGAQPEACCLDWQGSYCAWMTNDDGVDGCWPQVNFQVTAPYTHSLVTATFYYTSLGGSVDFRTDACGEYNTGNDSGWKSHTFDCGLRAAGTYTWNFRAAGGGEGQIGDLSLEMETEVPPGGGPGSECTTLSDAEFEQPGEWEVIGWAGITGTLSYGGVWVEGLERGVLRTDLVIDRYDVPYDVDAVARGSGSAWICLGDQGACVLLTPISSEWLTYTGYTNPAGVVGDELSIVALSGTVELSYLCVSPRLDSGGQDCLNIDADISSYDYWEMLYPAEITAGVAVLPFGSSMAQEFGINQPGRYRLSVGFSPEITYTRIVDILAGDSACFAVVSPGGEASCGFEVGTHGLVDIRIANDNPLYTDTIYVDRACVTRVYTDDFCGFSNSDFTSDVGWTSLGAGYLLSDGYVQVYQGGGISQVVTFTAITLDWDVQVRARSAVAYTATGVLTVSGASVVSSSVFNTSDDGQWATYHLRIRYGNEQLLGSLQQIVSDFQIWNIAGTSALFIDSVCLRPAIEEVLEPYGVCIVDNPGFSGTGSPWSGWVDPATGEPDDVEFTGGSVVLNPGEVVVQSAVVPSGSYRVIVLANSPSYFMSGSTPVYSGADIELAFDRGITDTRTAFLFHLVQGEFHEVNQGSIVFTDTERVLVSVLNRPESLGDAEIFEVCLVSGSRGYSVGRLGSCGDPRSIVPEKFDEEFPGTDISQYIPWLAHALYDNVAYPVLCFLVEVVNWLLGIWEAFVNWLMEALSGLLNPIIYPFQFIADLISLGYEILVSWWDILRFLLDVIGWYWRFLRMFWITSLPEGDPYVFVTVEDWLSGLKSFMSLPYMDWLARGVLLIWVFRFLNWIHVMLNNYLS